MKSTRTKKPPVEVELKNKTDLINVKDTNRVVIVFALLGISLVISSFSSLILANSNRYLAGKHKIYVEQADGSIEVASEQDPNYRSDAVIKETITNWLYLTWEWDDRIPGSSQPDRGISLKNEPNSVRVPSRVYVASYLMETGFRQEFLKGMSQLIPASFYRGDLTSNLVIYDIDEPIRNDKTNTYEVKVVATRKVLSNNHEKDEIKFDKLFILKPIEPYHLVLEESEPSAFRKQLNQLMKNGLLITEINNI